MHRPPPIQADEGRTNFAYFTLQQRLPIIVDRVLATGEYEASIRERLRTLRASLPDGIVPRELLTLGPDADFWQAWSAGGQTLRWTEMAFFHAEAAFYQALLGAIGYGTKSMDPFARWKEESLLQALGSGEIPSSKELLESNWSQRCEMLLKRAVGGGHSDLSQLRDVPGTETMALLVDDSPDAARMLDSFREPSWLDFALDNCGGELLADMALIDFLIASRPRYRVRVHCKSHPIFVSDVTLDDWHLTLRMLLSSSVESQRQLAARLARRSDDGRIELCASPFWTRPLHFTQLTDDLRSLFSTSCLVILKGDLNYRRYIEDRDWLPDCPAEVAVVPGMPPTVALRTLRSEVALGISSAKVSTAEKNDPRWRVSGRYAMIQIFGVPPGWAPPRSVRYG